MGKKINKYFLFLFTKDPAEEMILSVVFDLENITVPSEVIDDHNRVSVEKWTTTMIIC